MKIHTQFPCQPAGCRGSGHRALIACAGFGLQGRSRWHIFSFSSGCRLFFSRCIGFSRRRYRPDFRSRFFSVAEGQQHVADIDDLTGLDHDFQNPAGVRRRDFHGRFVGLHLQNRVTFYHLIAHRHQHGDHFPLVDSFS